MKPLVILASARSDGNTRKAVLDTFGEQEEFDFLDLRRKTISPYDYEREPADDFLGVVAEMIAHDEIVFATPVYWYAMSGVLKVFFDRLTELISVRKDLGRRLAGKRVGFLATGTDPDLPPGFAVPFEKTAAYFSMTFYRASYYVFRGDDIVGRHLIQIPFSVDRSQG